MKKIIFITGPVRSGKSHFALELAKRFKKQVTFIATCPPAGEAGLPKDREMKQRIRLHKASRPKNWQTVEETIDLSLALSKAKFGNIVVVDCITLWISNQLLNGLKEKDILKNAKKFINAVKKKRNSIIIVSNEVGWGIVPENKLARMFRDIIGNVHKEVARSSDEVYLVVSGVPLKIKS